jgi:lipopolysaccharide/colanic/teichoic acid biosynthesis glycosyltransferase
MTLLQRAFKRSFDILGASCGLFFLVPAACVLALVLKLTSPGPVFYYQKRIGRRGRVFTCVKFRTMSSGADAQGTITTASDTRITPIGKCLRVYKIDELPQLWNVLVGRMSFVGPRPDVPGYADRLEGDDRKMLELRPGITGPASLFFRYEEQLLADVSDPVSFNDSVIWPMKVALNLKYMAEWSFFKDIGYILVTIVPCLNRFFRLIPSSPRTLAMFPGKTMFHVK